jgi:hypothetical protein
MTPSFMTAGMVDITVLPITAIGGTEEALSTLESLGFIGVKVRQEGEEYIITYKGPDGQDYTQSCRYDASLDSIQSTVTDSSGRETVLFEYIKTADGYTAQYFFGDTAEYPWVTVYVGADISALGVSASGDRPDTLLLSATLGSDYVKKCETYFMLESDKLIIFDSGETITMVRKQH